MAAQLDSDWLNWIQTNVDRGCSDESMVQSMTRGGVDQTIAQAAIQTTRNKNRPGSAPSNTPTQAARPEPPATGQAKGGNDYHPEAPRLAAGNVIHTFDREVRVTMRLARPIVAILDNVLAPDECDELMARSADKLKRSTTVNADQGGFDVIDGRTSEGTFFPVNADAFIARIDRRIAELMNNPVEFGEGIQILHYNIGGEYTPHFDYFPPSQPGSQVQMASGGQRISSLIMYLNDVSGGGGTAFPELGLSVLPKKGMAVYFEYTNSRDEVDPLTLHAGLPVGEGEKWIATKWMRQSQYATPGPGTA